MLAALSAPIVTVALPLISNEPVPTMRLVRLNVPPRLMINFALFVTVPVPMSPLFAPLPSWIVPCEIVVVPE